MAVLGIDVAKATLEVALLIDEKRYRAQFTNDADGIKKLARWLKKHRLAQLHVGMEATNRYWEDVAYALHEKYHLSVINPKLIARHGEATLRRNKTDSEDALLIADYVQKNNPAAWVAPAVARRELQALERHRVTLIEERQRARNRLDSKPPSSVVRESLVKLRDYLDAEIDAIEGEIQAHIKNDDELRADNALLQSISGIGATTAASLLAEIPDVRHFAQASHLAAFAGLTPGQRQSGSSINKPAHIVKWGNSHIRRALFMPALSAGRHNPIVKALKGRLEERGKSKMTINVAMMRKLLHLAYGVLKHRQPFDPQYVN